MIKESALVYRLSADNKRLATDLARAKGTLSNFRNQSKAITSQVRASFAGMFGVTAGAYGIVRFASNTIDLVKRLDSLDKALKAVTETDEKYAKAQIFLSKTANEYGLEIEELTRSYNKFIASSKGTALEGEQTEEIFKKVAKASAVMALSGDEVEGVLRALGQMMSKGKVQAEELRGQLGDRLPGAFNIMADSMGVTTAQLDKMLKDGKVIADEVLPKFADQLLIAYGADKVDKIDTIVAAQNRLSNAWVEFVASVDSGSGVISRSLKSILNGLTDILTADQTGLEIGAKYAEGLGISNENLEDEIKRFEKLSSTIRKEISRLQKETKKEESRLFGLSKVTKDDPKVIEQIKNLQNEYAKTTGILSFLYKQELKHNKELEESAKKTKNLAKEINQATKKYKDLLGMVEITVSPDKMLTLSQFKPSDEFKTYEEYVKAFRSSRFNQNQINELTDALRGSMSRDQMFDGDISDLIGIDPEEVQEYWEEINSVMSAGYFSLQETINSEGMKTYEAAFNTGQFLMDAMVGISDAIAESSSIQDVFRSIFKMLADNMVQFGAALIAWGIAVKALKKSFSNPATAIAAGVALVAAGTALKGAIANAQSDFNGGGGGSGPSGSFSNNIAGQSVMIGGVFKIAGRDLKLVIDEQNRLNKRGGA